MSVFALKKPLAFNKQNLQHNGLQTVTVFTSQELLQSLKTLQVEEWDTNSLQIVEKEDVLPASTLTSMLPHLHSSEDEEDSEDMSCEWFQRDSEDPSDDIFPDDSTELVSEIERTDLQTPTQAFPTGYTTMEMFQQGMPQPVSTPVTQENEPEEADLTAVKSSLDYVRQFSTSPILDSEDVSTILWKQARRAWRNRNTRIRTTILHECLTQSSMAVLGGQRFRSASYIIKSNTCTVLSTGFKSDAKITVE